MGKFDEKMLSKKELFSGRVFKMELHKVELPDGSESEREIILHNGGACVVAVDDNDDIYLVSQFRYPFKEELLELPAGKINEGETSIECALRELEEETGHMAESMQLISESYATPAYCGEVLSIYLARGLTKLEQHLDPGEFLDVIKMPFEKAYRMVMDGRIKDAKTQIGILKAALLMGKDIKLI